MTKAQTRDALEIWGGFDRRAAELCKSAALRESQLDQMDETMKRARAQLRSAIRDDRAELRRITDVWRRVEAAVQALRTDEREIIRRKYVERRNMPYIAVMMGLSERTVYYYRREAERKIGETIGRKRKGDEE